MKKSIAVLSLGYWFSAYTLGLLLHPYKTARQLVRLPQFAPLAGAPVVMWFFAWIVGMVGLRFGGILLGVAGLTPTPAWLVLSLAFVFWWLTFFLGLWQVLVGYLWFRFSRLFR